nr:phosphate butyryltransferase [candidate division Zixibacteria bacterium]
MIRSFAELEDQVKSGSDGKKVPRMGIIYPRGGKCLEAATAAASEKTVKVSLISPREAIEDCIVREGCDLCGMEIVNVDSLEEAVRTGVKMARAGELDFLLKGSVGTRELIDVLLLSDTGFVSGGGILSHVGIMETERYHKLIFITDAAVNNEPDASTKIAITRNAATVARKLGVESPRAALLAAVEAIYPAVPVTMEEAAIAKMSDRGQIKDVIIDGPLSFDVAINAEVARSKGITNSAVTGETDIFVGPSMETANGLYKAMVIYVRARAAGLIWGGIAPLVTTFAADPIENVSNSIRLGIYLSQTRD